MPSCRAAHTLSLGAGARGRHKERNPMDTNLLIVIIVLVLLFGGGGGYYWRRGR